MPCHELPKGFLEEDAEQRDHHHEEDEPRAQDVDFEHHQQRHRNDDAYINQHTGDAVLTENGFFNK